MGANADAETREARIAVAVHGEIHTVIWEGYKALVFGVNVTIAAAPWREERVRFGSNRSLAKRVQSRPFCGLPLAYIGSMCAVTHRGTFL
jgi:hypothetical protein